MRDKLLKEIYELLDMLDITTLIAVRDALLNMTGDNGNYTRKIVSALAGFLK